MIEETGKNTSGYVKTYVSKAKRNPLLTVVVILLTVGLVAAGLHLWG